VVDTLTLARQLGLWRTLLMAMKQRQVIATARAAGAART